jgi:hypothetical protein
VRRGEDPATTSGTETAYTLTTDSGITSLNTGDTIAFIPHVSCGFESTLNINSIGALSLVVDGRKIHPGDILAGSVYYGVVLGSSIQILNPNKYLGVLENDNTLTYWYSDRETFTATLTSTGTVGVYQQGMPLNGNLTITALWADADSVQGLAIRDGYLYMNLLNIGVETRTYRCPLTSAIGTAGNWEQLTVTYPDIIATLIGYGNGAFWVMSNSTYIPYTLSGTTLTDGTPVTVTGSNYGSGARVNECGIYASFGSGNRTRHASFDGTLSGREGNSSNSSRIAVSPGALYIPLTGTSTRPYYRVVI